MFIAAFVAGRAAQAGFREVAVHSVEFTEDWGQLLNLFVFLIFGLFVAQVWTQFSVAVLLYAVLGLTLIRIVPVAIALHGTGLSRPTARCMGRFGPRVLASIVLGLGCSSGTRPFRASRRSDSPSWRPCCSASSRTGQVLSSTHVAPAGACRPRAETRGGCR